MERDIVGYWNLMKLNDFYFLVLGAFSGLLVSLTIFTGLSENRLGKTISEPRYIMVPNETDISRKAGDDYLRVIQSQTEHEKTGKRGEKGDTLLSRFRELYELSKVPVWSFSNEEYGLYLRNGAVNGEPGSWWNWSIILGDAVSIGRELPRMSEALCEESDLKKEDLRVAVVGALRTGSRLLAGNPPLITGIIGLFWGEVGAGALEGCPSLLEDSEVRSAVKEFSELCTVEPGIEWETVVLPQLVDGYSPALNDHSAGELRDKASRLKSKLLSLLKK